MKTDSPEHFDAKRLRSFRRAFTLIELLVVIAIIAILASLLASGLGRAKGLAHLTKCASNERQMGFGIHGYLGDHRMFPGNFFQAGAGASRSNLVSTPWYTALAPYAGQTRLQELYNCPGYTLQFGWDGYVRKTDDAQDYGYNQYGPPPSGGSSQSWSLGLGEALGTTYAQIREDAVVHPSEMIAIGDHYDVTGEGGERGQPGILTYMVGFQTGSELDKESARKSTKRRHTGRFNLLFVDCHVASMKPSRLFGHDDGALSRLHNDNQPHREAIDWDSYPKIKECRRSMKDLQVDPKNTASQIAGSGLIRETRHLVSYEELSNPTRSLLLNC